MISFFKEQKFFLVGLALLSLLLLSPLVNAAPVTLDWDHPTAREACGNPPLDRCGAALARSEIQGYRIFYGPSSGKYTNHIDVGPVGHATIDLPAGFWYVAMKTIDTGGRESRYSMEVTRDVPNTNPPDQPAETAPPEPPSKLNWLEEVVRALMRWRS